MFIETVTNCEPKLETSQKLLINIVCLRVSNDVTLELDEKFRLTIVDLHKHCR